MKKTVKEKDILEFDDIKTSIEKVNGVWKLNGIKLSEQQIAQLHIEATSFKQFLLYQVLFGTEKKRIEDFIIRDAKTHDEINYYRAMLADRVMIHDAINQISVDYANQNLFKKQ